MFAKEVSLAVYSQLRTQKKNQIMRDLILDQRYSERTYPIQSYTRYDGLKTLPFLGDLSKYHVHSLKTDVGYHLKIRSGDLYPRIDIFNYPDDKSEIIIRTENYRINGERYVVEAIFGVPFYYFYIANNKVHSSWVRDYENNRWVQLKSF